MDTLSLTEAYMVHHAIFYGLGRLVSAFCMVFFCRALGLVLCPLHDARKLQALPSPRLLTKLTRHTFRVYGPGCLIFAFCMVHRLCCQIRSDLPGHSVNEYCTG
jgi:hypothetical protein